MKMEKKGLSKNEKNNEFQEFVFRFFSWSRKVATLIYVLSFEFLAKQPSEGTFGTVVKQTLFPKISLVNKPSWLDKNLQSSFI